MTRGNSCNSDQVERALTLTQLTGRDGETFNGAYMDNYICNLYMYNFEGE